MSVNIQTPNGLVNISGDKVTANKITSALGYTPADKDEHYTKTEVDNKLNDLPTGDSEHNHDDRYAAKNHYHNEYRKPIWHEITGEGLTVGECWQLALDFSNGHTVILYKNDENGNIASEETIVATNNYTDYSINDSGDFINEIYTTKHVYSFNQQYPNEYIVNCVERSGDLSNYYTKTEIDTKNEEFSTDIQNVENSIQDLQNALEDEIEYISIDRSDKSNIAGALSSFTYKELAQIMTAYDSNKHIVLKVIASSSTTVIVPNIMYQTVSSIEYITLNISYQNLLFQCNCQKSKITANPTSSTTHSCQYSMWSSSEHNHDSKYAAKDHTHDNYYTKEEVDNSIDSLVDSIQDLQNDIGSIDSKIAAYMAANYENYDNGSF